MNTRSLRFRLIAWYAGLMLAVFALLGGLMVFRLRGYLEDNLLQTQSRRAQQIAETLLARTDQTGEANLIDQIKALYAPELSGRFIRVTRKDGSTLYTSGPPNDQTFDPADVPKAPESPQRIFTRRQMLPDGRALLIAASRGATAGGGSYLVEVGASTASIDTMLDHLLALLAVGLPVVLVVAVGGGYLLVRRALSPVDQIAGKAEVITQHNLNERLPVARTGDELERLSVSLNHMITRLDDAFQNSKRFVADASHELRTPLAILRGELEALVEDGATTQDQRDQLGSLLEEVERLTKIVERLFALSRLDAGEAQAEWVTLDLGELAATTADQMRLLAEDKHIALTCETESRAAISGDRVRLKEIVVNLLDNAIKYTPAGGAIHLRVAAAHGQAVLEVTDTGIGIPAEALGHVFDRFFRVGRTTPDAPDGAGLGLSIVKSISNAHGGEVEVDSVPGRGSRFRVKLPLALGKIPDSKLSHDN
jgi:heavy metal sensor kinase